jgi:hypothetical protein
MPKSKHRRKPGCKSVQHPGREAKPQRRDLVVDLDLASYSAGWDAHAKGEPCGPIVDLFTVETVSWRMGWNDRALEQDHA